MSWMFHYLAQMTPISIMKSFRHWTSDQRYRWKRYHTWRIESATNIACEHMEKFRTSLSSGPLLDIKLLEDDLIPIATHSMSIFEITLNHNGYSFPHSLELSECDMIYANVSSSWDCAPLVVPKPGLNKFRLTVDLRPVSYFVKKHQHPCP